MAKPSTAPMAKWRRSHRHPSTTLMHCTPVPLKTGASANNSWTIKCTKFYSRLDFRFFFAFHINLRSFRSRRLPFENVKNVQQRKNSIQFSFAIGISASDASECAYRDKAKTKGKTTNSNQLERRTIVAPTLAHTCTDAR